MKTRWRGRGPQLHSHRDWVAKLESKNRQPGTSAPTIAVVWAGIVELYGSLNRESGLHGFVMDEIIVEQQATVDRYPGGRRNHDLVVRGCLPQGQRVVVCVEAKAGEDLGATVKDQRKVARKAVEKAQAKGKTSNAEKRLHALLERFVPEGTEPRIVEGLRYQLLTALAGTLSEARKQNCEIAVLMVHDFRTNERPTDMRTKHDEELRAFREVVFGAHVSDGASHPRCWHLGPFCDTPDVDLYLVWAFTDLRDVALRQRA